jgi:hypothetical protein
MVALLMGKAAEVNLLTSWKLGKARGLKSYPEVRVKHSLFFKPVL